jgi:hypothetical protein
MKSEQPKENVLTTGSSTREKLVGFFKRNIDLTLRNVNIKSERKIEERPFTVGVTLQELLCSSENKEGLFMKTGKIDELHVWCHKGHWKSKLGRKLKDCKDKENSSRSLGSLLGSLLSNLFDLIENNKKENAVDSEEVYQEQDIPEEDNEFQGDVADQVPIKMKIEDINFAFLYQDNEERQQPCFSVKYKSLVLNIAHFFGVQNHPLATLQVTEGSLKANIFEVEQQWQFRTGTVEIKDERSKNTAYRSILQQVDQATPLDVTVKIDLSDFVRHINIKVTAPPLQLIYLTGFVKDISRVFLSTRETASEVTEKALTKQTNMDPQKIFKTRVTFDVSMTTPIVVIPRDSTEGFVVVFNFAKLILNNHFELVPKDKSQGQKVTAKLRNFKLLTGVYKNGKVRFQRSLTKPITLTIKIGRSTLKRNESDYDISIKAKSAKISVSLKETDVPTILKTLSENISEARFFDKMSECKEKRSPFSDGPASPDIPLPRVCTTIKTTITLDGLELELLKGYKSEIVTITKVFQVENKFLKY